ncbi:MAG TPA: outer membrane beta-barrel protein [Pseudolabrys sp.]|jgi:outer membrane immunogenic protein
MRHLKCALLAAAATVACVSFASAADMRPAVKAPAFIPVPVQTWTGCYVGGNIGAGWARGQMTVDPTGSGVSATNSGFVGGVQVGCDYQFAGGFVIGARDMFDGASLTGGSTFVSGPLTGGTVDGKTQWFNTLTARLGYAAWPNTLLYVHGGGAWSRSTQTVTVAGVNVGTFSNNKGGYDVGGGVEYRFAPNWTAFLEYNYMNFGSGSGITGTGVPVSFKRDLQNVVVGVNYRF